MSGFGAVSLGAVAMTLAHPLFGRAYAQQVDGARGPPPTSTAGEPFVATVVVGPQTTIALPRNGFGASPSVSEEAAALERLAATLS